MNMNRIRVKNVYKISLEHTNSKILSFLKTVRFIFVAYVIYGTKENNIFNAFIWGVKYGKRIYDTKKKVYGHKKI